MEELEIPRLKKEATDATAAKEELQMTKAEVEKLASEIELARASLAADLEKLKAENADLLKSSQAISGERGYLNEVVKQVNSKKKELIDARIEAETDVEVKDAYIRHLAYVLEPQLGGLPAEVAEEIKGPPAVFDIEVIPQKYKPPRT